MLGWLSLEAGTSRTDVDSNYFPFDAVYHWGDSKRKSVMVRIEIRWVIRISHIEKALVHSSVIIDTVRT